MKSGSLIGLLSRLIGGGIIFGRLSSFTKLRRDCVLARMAATVVMPGRAAARPENQRITYTPRSVRRARLVPRPSEDFTGARVYRDHRVSISCTRMLVSGDRLTN